MHSILRREDVEARTGLPRSTIYNEMQKGAFPKPINLGGRRVGWVEAEVNEWITAKMAERDAAPS